MGRLTAVRACVIRFSLLDASMRRSFSEGESSGLGICDVCILEQALQNSDQSDRNSGRAHNSTARCLQRPTFDRRMLAERR